MDDTGTPSETRSSDSHERNVAAAAAAAAGGAVSSPVDERASPPASPGASNRFGLSLSGIIGRRPRGLSASASRVSPGNSPANEMPPPSPGDRAQQGYGFPALRRQLSKRHSTAPSGSAARLRRSSSQPPEPAANTSTAAAAASRAPAFPPLTQSTSLPNGANAEGASTAATTAHIRLVPHLEATRSLHFEPIDRDATPNTTLRVGRFTDKSGLQPQPGRIMFRSKVVSRSHAEVWCDDAGKFYIRDTKSSSGTFLNHIRLSAPGVESRPFALKDGDVLQLGVDYQGGTEEIYRCVKMRVELNRAWQRGANAFNKAALAQLRALGGGSAPEASKLASAVAKGKSTMTDCCICLYPVTVCQALFIAPCSHVTHFKCIRPLIEQNYPGFSCPLCRTYADLEADVEIDEEDDKPATVEEEESMDVDGAAANETAANAEDANADDVNEDVDADNVSSVGAMPMIPSAAPPDATLDAATPSNTTFLSTLADSRPVSLDHAVSSMRE